MDADGFTALLQDLHACFAAQRWARGKSLREAYRKSRNASRMLWLAFRMAGARGWPTRAQAIHATCDVAEAVRDLIPKGKRRAAKLIEAARAVADGKATRQQCRDAVWRHGQIDQMYDDARESHVQSALVATLSSARAADVAYTAGRRAMDAVRTTGREPINFAAIVRRRISLPRAAG